MIREYIVKITDEVMENDAELFKNPPILVRCKDCRFGYISEFAPPEMRDVWCCASNHILATVKPDFFCGDGKAKEVDKGAAD